MVLPFTQNEKAQVPSFYSLLGQVGEASSLGGTLNLSSRRNLCYKKSSRSMSSVSDTYYSKAGWDMFPKLRALLVIELLYDYV